MNSDPQQDIFRAAERVRKSPSFIASLFKSWERAFGRTVAAALEVDAAKIVSLGLCLRPRDNNWAEDIEEIAGACGLDAGRLALLLRQALAAERLAGAPPVGEVVDGRLLAARDRDGDSEK